MPSDFAQLYCEHFRSEPAAFRQAVLRRTLYPQARLLRPLLRVFKPDFFAADFDFIDSVGRITRRRDFSSEADEFVHHPENRGFWRRTLRLRVSVGRMHRLVGEVFGETSTHPFPHPSSPAPLNR